MARVRTRSAHSSLFTMMQKTQEKAAVRYHDLDALRAVAMILGIALHGALSFVPFPWSVQDSEQHEFFGTFFTVIHGFRMPVFFVMRASSRRCSGAGAALVRS